tara:strand:- start:90 stop:329 length:240 start_codon:yes stop_codon:yes gene_type:complete
MKEKDVSIKIEEVLQKVFKKEFNKKNISKLKIGDFKEWDSLGNFNLLLEIEKVFKLRFKPKDLLKITSINQIINYIKKK